jgi:transposase-like protein
MRVVFERRAEHPIEWAAMKSIAVKLGIGTAKSLRTWVRQAEVNAGEKPGATKADSEEIRRLRRENAGSQAGGTDHGPAQARCVRSRSRRPCELRPQKRLRRIT